MGKLSIVVGTLAALAAGVPFLAVGIAIAEQALAPQTSRGSAIEEAAGRSMGKGRKYDTTPCREGSGRLNNSHTHHFFPLAEACRQEWRRAHGTHIIPDSYRGPSRGQSESSAHFNARANRNSRVRTTD